MFTSPHTCDANSATFTGDFPLVSLPTPLLHPPATVLARQSPTTLWRRRRTLRVGLFGSLGLPNFGDELILRATLDQLAQQHPQARVHLFSFRPDVSTRFLPRDLPLDLEIDDSLWQTVFSCRDLVTSDIRSRCADLARAAGRYRVPAFIKRLAKAVSRVDVVHGVGGGYLNAHSPHSLLAASLLIEIALAQGKRVAFTGQTVGPCDAACITDLLPQWARVQYFDLRDDSEHAHLMEVGVPVSQSCDDAFLAFDLCRRLAGSPSDEPHRIVVCLHQQTTAPDVRARLFTALGQLVAAVRQGSLAAQLTFLELTPHRGSDRQVFDALGLANSPECTWVPFRSVEATLAQIVGPETRAVLGTRLHLALPALMCGIPCLSLAGDEYYARKLAGIHRAYDSPHWLRTTELQPQTLVDFVHATAGRGQPDQLARSVTLAALKQQVLADALGY